MSIKNRLLIASTFLFLFFFPILLKAHGINESDQHTLSHGSLLDYILVGAKHMLTGYDHLLFLTGVIFYLKGFKDILKFITVFTIGHSITLIFATYMGISANEHIIDAIIAISVIYKGFENLDGFKKILKVESPNLLSMVFIFGLIHGFGLSTRLQAFDIGSENVLAKILSFNIGVELGQIAALIPIVFVISKWKQFKSYQMFYKLANWFLIVAGAGLMVYQLYGYFNPHDHGANNSHPHSHEQPHDHGDVEHSHDHGDGEHSHDHGDGENSHDHGDGEHSHDH
ncbi:MAG TPA: HupE/UreJ family protein [Saprospiraceae bacterium]|nr:HupE/UreJ family protein [Saprospiraceae bacterium]